MGREHPLQAPRHHIRHCGSSGHPLDRSSHHHHVGHPRHGCYSGLHGQTRHIDRCHEDRSHHDARNRGHGHRNGRMSRDSCNRHVDHHHHSHHHDDRRSDQSGRVEDRELHPLFTLLVRSRPGRAIIPLTSFGRTKILSGRRCSRASPPSFFDAKSSTFKNLTLQSLLCSVCLLSCDHLNETKATGFFGVRVQHYSTLLHVTVLFKESRNL